jgi:hypothetical protein
LVGNVYRGVVEATVLVGDIEGGKVRVDVHLGRRARGAKLASRKRARTSR